MFIIKKEKDGREYYYLRESTRKNGKVKTKDLAYLGKTKKDAEKKMKEFLKQRDNKNNKMENKKEEKIIEIKKIETKPISIDDIANFCKKKGFIFRSSDIYGGFAGFWDFGPLGIELFNNIKKEWWKFFVQERDNMVGIEASIISHPNIWKASGHLQSFSDVAVICKKCKNATKIDKSEVGKIKCDCGGEYDIKGEFNLMFKTNVGAIKPVEAYLRGETAQGMFTDFKLVQQTSRMQLPFGIAQIGKCFRNEIAPRDFLFRSREFHIGEFEFFINPEDDKCSLLTEKIKKIKLKILDEETQKKGESNLREITIKEMLEKNKLGEWHAYWLAEQILWFRSLGLDEIKIREHTKDELSHYSSATFDIDYEYPFGSKEVAGNANRGQYDLTQHQKESKQNMEIFDEKTGKKVLPKVIEPTFGIERIFLAILTKAYCYDEKRQNIILKIPPKLSPIKAAIFPLVKADEKLVKISKGVYEDLKKEFYVAYDESGSLGRRYSRADEIGIPITITLDKQSIQDKTVTLRDRDTTEQIRIKISEIKEIINKVIKGQNLLTFGKIVKTRVK